MDGLSRRNVLGGGAAFAGGLMAVATSAPLAAASTQPPFGPPRPPLAEKDLPSFRFALSKRPAVTFDGGWVNEAKVPEFPVSEKLAGALLELEPGGLRELHWHASSGEWVYVLSGHCRISILGPDDQAETSDFGPGDVSYFPRGYGHSLQGLGDGPCLALLAFDNGYFSEYGTFSIADWVAQTPPAVLARNFGVPESTFAGFPTGANFISQGAVPPPLPADPAPGSLSNGPLSYRYRLLAQAPETFPGGTIRIVSSRQFPVSTTMTGALLQIDPGAMQEMHWHPDAAEWQYYIKGTGRMTVYGSNGRSRTEEFSAGDVGYVPQSYGHYIENTGDDDLEIMTVLNNGTYDSITLTSWMAHNTPELLGTNFNVPASTFAGFSK